MTVLAALVVAAATIGPVAAFTAFMAVGGASAGHPPHPTGQPTPAGRPVGAQLVAAGAVPTSLRISAIGVRAKVEPLRLDRSGRLRPPRDPADAGWWVGGPAPGDLGAAVLAGHLDSRTGPALFWRLARLRAGDRVRVVRRDGRTASFTVDSVRVFPAADFPTRLVYGPSPDRALRLITCGGSFDRVHGHYLDNVVVFATAR
ncbi:MAG: class F sortase [Actinomycetes bacterium]